MPGIAFSEVMSGPFALGTTDLTQGQTEGAQHGYVMAVRLSVNVPDLDRFLRDKNHRGDLTAEVTFSQWENAATACEGVFHLFRPADAPAAKIMEYQIHLELDGVSFFLRGRKHVRDDPGADAWRDTTTLETFLHEGTDGSGKIVGAGVLRLGLGEQISLLRTLRPIDAGSRAEGLKTVGRFVQFFLGELWHVYGRNPAPKAGMVGWYDPTLFLRAGVEVVVSSLFAQYADQRLLQATGEMPDIFDYSGSERRTIPIKESGNHRYRTAGPSSRAELWIDYVADTGDGWDSTYAIAALIAQPELTISASGKSSVTSAGDILVFGGDQVYPSASRVDYQRRLVAPYRAAFGVRSARDYPDVFAIPGNHDWYDGLVSFSRVFCSHEPFAGPPVKGALEAGHGCVTPQRRSYFAIKLPHGWWMLGTDVQLRSDLDGPQLDFFKAVAGKMSAEDRVILCVAEPHWLYPKRVEKGVSPGEETALDVLENQVLGKRVQVFLAGDVHHYKRYASDDGVQKITAGGGGAFLHPTHGPWPDEIEADGRAFRHKASFPSRHMSWWLGCRNVFFLALNPKFGTITGIFYLVLALLMMPAVFRYQNDQARNKAPTPEELVRNIETLVRKEVAQQVADRDSKPDKWFVGNKSALDAVHALERFQANLRPKSLKERLQSIRQSGVPAESIDEAPIPPELPKDDTKTGVVPAAPDPAYGFWSVLWGVLVTEAKLIEPFQTLLFSLILVLVLFAFYFFTDIPERFLRFLFGAFHSLVHFFTAFFLVWLSFLVLIPWFEQTFSWDPDYFSNWIILAISFAGGFVLGPIIMGVYLGVSLNLFGRHWNEAFSSLRIRDWKNFLRLHIDARGTLTIFPVGIRAVPRAWKDEPSDDGSRVIPAGAKLRPELIETPIRIEATSPPPSRSSSPMKPVS